MITKLNGIEMVESLRVQVVQHTNAPQLNYIIKTKYRYTNSVKIVAKRNKDEGKKCVRKQNVFNNGKTKSAETKKKYL